MRVLFIGGTGVISSACSELALSRGIELFLLNRGQSIRPAPAGATILNGDIRDRASVERAIDGLSFDAVVNWIAFTPDQVQQDVEVFRGRTEQYVFISSAAVYHKPPANLPTTESAPLGNPLWEYAANKVACEELLMAPQRRDELGVTIVRPSHTYDRTKLPCSGGWTAVARMRAGKPVVIHGDGTSTWVLTHHTDFAKGFVGLLGNSRTLGEAFHITSDELLTWNQIYAMIARAAGAELQAVHAPSTLIARYHKDWGDGLLGDKSHSVLFDNSKIKRFVPDFVCTVPYAQGVRETLAWFEADASHQLIDERFDTAMDRVIEAMARVTV